MLQSSIHVVNGRSCPSWLCNSIMVARGIGCQDRCADSSSLSLSLVPAVHRRGDRNSSRSLSSLHFIYNYSSTTINAGSSALLSDSSFVRTSQYQYTNDSQIA